MKPQRIDRTFRNFCNLMSVLYCSAGFGASLTPKNSPPENTQIVSLDEAYQAAIVHSEVIADQEEQIKQAEEHYNQAFGSMLPTIAGSYSFTKQAQDLGPVSPGTSHTTKLTLAQPLFRGFREYQAITLATTNQTAQNEAKASAIKGLKSDVAQAFVAILTTERDITNLNDEFKAYDDRIKELNERIKIGRSRQTEILSIRSSAVALKAQEEQLRNQLAASRELFSFVTGLPKNVTLNASRLPSVDLMPPSNYLEHIKERPDIKTNSLKIEAADLGIKMARNTHLPSIDLNGNYYISRDGFASSVPWDATLSVTVPIYSGGITNSKVREATSQKVEADLAMARSLRAAEQEINTLYNSVASDTKQISLLQESVDISKKNVTKLKSEYQTGLATNIEVLQAITNLQETNRLLDKARFAQTVDYLKLTIASELSDPSKNSSQNATK